MTVTDRASARITEARTTAAGEAPVWHQTACILCECNGGIEVRLGGDDGRFERSRGDKDRDAIAGTPWHKHVRARVEAVA